MAQTQTGSETFEANQFYTLIPPCQGERSEVVGYLKMAGPDLCFLVAMAQVSTARK